MSISSAQNKKVIGCAQGSSTSNKHVFSLLQKVCKETDAERMLAGKLFHKTGPATARLRVSLRVIIPELEQSFLILSSPVISLAISWLFSITASIQQDIRVQQQIL